MQRPLSPWYFLSCPAIIHHHGHADNILSDLVPEASGKSLDLLSRMTAGGRELAMRPRSGDCPVCRVTTR